MSGFQIPRDDVHHLSEACAEAGEAFRSTAARLVRSQPRLTSFIRANMPELDGTAGQVGLYIYAVTLRVLERCGGRMKKVSGRQIDAAAARVSAATEALLPFDAGFPGRVREVATRAQPHLLDEMLWALFEKQERIEGEVDLPPDQAGLVFLLLWVAVEALDACWEPATRRTGDAGPPPTA